MSDCKGCRGKSERYVPKTVGQPQGDEMKQETLYEGEHPSDIERRAYEAYTQSSSEASLNKFSFDTLESMRKDVEDKQKEAFIQSLRELTDDVRAASIMTFIRVYNGEDFSAQGHTPKFALRVLNTFCDLPMMKGAFSIIEKKFPSIRAEIKEKFEIMLKNNIFSK